MSFVNDPNGPLSKLNALQAKKLVELICHVLHFTTTHVLYITLFVVNQVSGKSYTFILKEYIVVSYWFSNGDDVRLALLWQL